MSDKIISTVQNICTTANKSTKGRVPRYLYHLTSAVNFEKMKSDTFCYASGKDKYLKQKGVFMFDLTNFLKDWSKRMLNGECKRSLQEMLLDEVSCSIYDPSGIVVLKIPTSELDIQNLKIRSQNTFFKARKGLDKFSPEELEHLQQGTSALYSSLYKQRKCPIEYIYQGDIPVKKISMIGQLTGDDYMQIDRKPNENWNLKGTFMALFKNTPEQKAVEKM